VVAWAAAVRGPVVVTEYVLVESVNHLSAPGIRQRAHRLADLIRRDALHQFIPGSPALLQAGLDMHRSRPDKDWSLTDCISFHAMQQYGLTQALAYDYHFEQAGFEALLRREPEAP